MRIHLMVWFFRCGCCKFSECLSCEGIRPASPLWPPVNRNILEAFGIHQSGSCFMIVQRCGREDSPNCVRRQFLADTRASKLKGKYGTIKKRCTLLMKFLIVPDTYNLIVDIELTKTEVTVRIKLSGLTSNILFI